MKTSGRYIICCNYKTKQYSEKILASFERCIVCLKNASGQSFKVKIGKFGMSLVKYNVMNTRIGFWQIAEINLN